MTAFLHATLKIRPGLVPRFNAVLAELKPALEAEGWRLAGAWTTTIGRLSEIVDVWELPDANAVADVLGVVSRHPSFPDWYAELNAVVEEEVVKLMTKVPYSP